MSLPQMSPIEVRVIASLAEKSITNPQSYPMTVNAVMLAANQKTSRHPVMQLTEGEVGNALNRLEELRMCSRDPFSGRAQKWRQQFQHQLLLGGPAFAVLLSLVLRGPQTLAELRSTAAVLGGPTEAAALASALESLNDRAEPLAVLLPRGAGQKEARYAHAMNGMPEVASFQVLLPVEPRSPTADLAARVAALEERIAALEKALGVG